MPFPLNCKRNKIGEDFYETPPETTNVILPYIDPNVKTIYEPTYGKGAIANVLKQHGYTIIASDLYPKNTDGVDCPAINYIELTQTPPNVDLVVYNPPFCIKRKFIEKSCQLGTPFMALVPLSTLETQDGHRIFKQYHLSILSPKKRTNYRKNEKGNAFFHSVWVLGNIPKYQDRLLYE